jgi:hypothetical protein
MPVVISWQRPPRAIEGRPPLATLRRMRRGIGWGIICLLALICVGCAKEDAPVIVQGGTRAASAPTSSTPRALPTIIDHDGLFKVGTDMSPGLWHTDGGKRRTMYNPDGTQTVDSQCHWATGPLATQNGRPFMMEPTARGDDTGPQDVMIGQREGAFSTLGCRDWHLR